MTTPPPPLPAGFDASHLREVQGHIEAACHVLGLSVRTDGIEEDDLRYELFTSLAVAWSEAHGKGSIDVATLPEPDDKPVPDVDRAFDCVKLAFHALGEEDMMPDMHDDGPLHDAFHALIEAREELYTVIQENDSWPAGREKLPR